MLSPHKLYTNYSTVTNCNTIAASKFKFNRKGYIVFGRRMLEAWKMWEGPSGYTKGDLGDPGGVCSLPWNRYCMGQFFVQSTWVYTAVYI